ncbi:MAG TPA: glycosyltransferase family 4 protein [Actinomycetota bacterium]|nr:glycosyltransferase family 4 protein [Actinomycetota bacterium]
MSFAWPDPPALVVAPDDLPDQPVRPRVKVLHVITRFWAGAGGNTLVSALGMDPRRYDVWIAGVPGGPLWERARRAGITCVELEDFHEYIAPLADLRVFLRMIALMRRERFQIVHTHSSKAGVMGRLAAWMARTPVIVHTFHGFSFHDFMSARRRAAYLFLERLARPAADEIFAVAPQVAREAVERRLARPGRISVVPSAVELDDIPHEADPSVRAELGIPDGCSLVGTVGRLDFQKSPLDFVRMAAIVSRARADVRFVMVGDGTLEQKARDEAARLGAPVLFTGFRPDAARIASAFDVFVVSSLYEGLGRSLTEALASGRPVVATAVNGVPDLVEPGATGLLVKPRDPDGLARSVLWMIEHPERAKRMGEQGRARVRSIFVPEQMCALLDASYRRLLGMPQVGAATRMSRLRIDRARARSAAPTLVNGRSRDTG